MNKDQKIPIPLIKAAIETYEKISFTDEEWDTGLFGWRKKHKFHTSKTRKGWIKEKEALTLVRYFISPYVLISVGKKGVCVF